MRPPLPCPPSPTDEPDPGAARALRDALRDILEAEGRVEILVDDAPEAPEWAAARPAASA